MEVLISVLCNSSHCSKNTSLLFRERHLYQENLMLGKEWCKQFMPRLSVSQTNVKNSFKYNFPVRDVAMRVISKGKVLVYDELAVSLIMTYRF